MKYILNILVLAFLVSLAHADNLNVPAPQAVTSQVVNSTRDLTAASGSQTLTFNFTPTSCDGFGTVIGTITQNLTTLTSHSDSAAVQSDLVFFAAEYIIQSNFFGAFDATGTNFQNAVLSYGVNSVVLTWTKSGTPTGTFTFSVRCFK